MIPYNLNLFRRTPDQSAEAFCSPVIWVTTTKQKSKASHVCTEYISYITYVTMYVCCRSVNFSLSLPNNN